jgi:hypothetical protein
MTECQTSGAQRLELSPDRGGCGTTSIWSVDEFCNGAEKMGDGARDCVDGALARYSLVGGKFRDHRSNALTKRLPHLARLTGQ